MKPQVSLAVDNTVDDPTRPVELILGGNDFTSITKTVSDIVLERKTPRAWYLAFFATAGLTGVLFLMIGWLFIRGVGVWGLNNPVGWAWDITNFVFWIGIGHAGTLISAILFLLRQNWRTSINRAAEAMTIFAVICAGIFPGIHVGRVWMAWLLFPIPNANAIWPNFRSPLLWDVFAVGTYFTVSLIFWYIGHDPGPGDAPRPRQPGHAAADASTASSPSAGAAATATGATTRWPTCCWPASPRRWCSRCTRSCRSTSPPRLMPGWHTTIFPPYFVAGAIFGGFAMVLHDHDPRPQVVSACRT